MVLRKEHFWNYNAEIHSLLNTISLENFNHVYGNITRDRLFVEFTTKSSFFLYQLCNIRHGKQLYLNDLNAFKSSRLKLLERTKSFRMQMSESAQCPMCKMGNAEDLEHFFSRAIEHSLSIFVLY